MKLYNTLTKTKDPVRPLDGKTLKIYTCGLTVYSQPHIGNWLAYISWDLLERTLIASGFSVDRVQNITDVGHLTDDNSLEDSGDDKLQAAADREGSTAWDIADKYIAVAEDEAYNLLGLLRPARLARATDYIDNQIELVQTLETKGFTYILDDGVYFDTSKTDDYGKLYGLDVASLQPKARVKDSGKKNPTDFALWKLSPENEKRDMEWQSPWGKGFPGWHLECSAIILKLLGETIDIHTGGIDHIPIHHTNEIAQSESATGKDLAKIWLHCNFIKVDGQKMSKSLGNIYTLTDLVNKGFSPASYKLLVLSKHYRTEGNFSWDIISDAQAKLKKYQAFADLRFQVSSNFPELAAGYFADQYSKILAHLQNDLNSPLAFSVLGEVISHVEEVADGGIHESSQAEYLDFLDNIEQLFGLGLTGSSDISSQQRQLIQKRETARSDQDWQASDGLRDQLREHGLALKDTQGTTVWERI